MGCIYIIMRAGDFVFHVPPIPQPKSCDSPYLLPIFIFYILFVYHPLPASLSFLPLALRRLICMGQLYITIHIEIPTPAS
ncbi:hypothetical protein P167DRAFT_540139 [Morchella conica CCBAS932]|uniref:Uncharacterized protein n=1 Tax=Morchella conica CCBAS932 TaxID=1392247 RepID=A0A3N4KA54_9PEZI|nr:hypothetical protein P167DRAFT_540139 [Morchella conica CCBAS932]